MTRDAELLSHLHEHAEQRATRLRETLDELELMLDAALAEPGAGDSDNSLLKLILDDIAEAIREDERAKVLG